MTVGIVVVCLANILAWVYLNKKPARSNIAINTSNSQCTKSTDSKSPERVSRNKRDHSSLDATLVKRSHKPNSLTLKNLVRTPRKQSSSLSYVNQTHPECLVHRDSHIGQPDEPRQPCSHDPVRIRLHVADSRCSSQSCVQAINYKRSHEGLKSAYNSCALSSALSTEDSGQLNDFFHEKKKAQMKQKDNIKTSLQNDAVQVGLSLAENCVSNRKGLLNSAQLQADNLLEHRGDTALAHSEIDSPLNNDQVYKNHGQGEPCIQPQGAVLDSTITTRNAISNRNSPKKEGNSVDKILVAFQKTRNELVQKYLNETKNVSSLGQVGRSLPQCYHNGVKKNSRTVEICGCQRCLHQQQIMEQKINDLSYLKSLVMPEKLEIHSATSAREDNIRALTEELLKMRVQAAKMERETSKQASQCKEQVIDEKQGYNHCEEKRNSKAQLIKLLKSEDVAPPPMGYHVRKDSSNVDSISNLHSAPNCRTKKDNVLRQQNSTGKDQVQQQAISSDEALNSNSDNYTWKIVCPKTFEESRRHLAMKGCPFSEKRKRSRRLVIIGKLNNRKKTDDSGGQPYTARGNNNRNDASQSLNEGAADRRGRAADGGRTVSREARDCGNGEKLRTCEEAKYAKVREELQRQALKEAKHSVQEGNNKSKTPGLHGKRFPCEDPVIKLNSGLYLKRVDVKVGVPGDNNLHKRSVVPCYKITDENRHNSQSKGDDPVNTDLHAVMNVTTSCLMNVNSNAGIFESLINRTPEQTAETSLTQNSSNPDSDQINSSQTETDRSCGVDQPRSSSFTEKDVITIPESKENTEQPIAVSKSSDSVIYHTKQEKQSKGVRVEAAETPAETSSKTSVNTKDKKEKSKSYTALKVASNAANSLLLVNKRKKGLVVDTAANKLENIMAKRVQAMSPSGKNINYKMWNKLKQEHQNHTMPPPADVHGAVNGDVHGAVGTDVHNAVTGDVPSAVTGDIHDGITRDVEKTGKIKKESAQFDKVNKSSEDDNSDVKAKQKPLYEVNLVYASLREPNTNMKDMSASMKGQNTLARSKLKSHNQEASLTETDRRLPSEKLQETAAKFQEVMNRLNCLPKANPPQPTSKRTHVSSHHEVYSGNCLAEHKSLNAGKSIVKQSSSTPTPQLEKSGKPSISPTSPQKGDEIGSEFFAKVNKDGKIIDAQKASEFYQRSLNSSPRLTMSTSSTKKACSSLNEEGNPLVKNEINFIEKTEENSLLTIKKADSKEHRSVSPKLNLSKSPEHTFPDMVSPSSELYYSPQNRLEDLYNVILTRRKSAASECSELIESPAKTLADMLEPDKEMKRGSQRCDNEMDKYREKDRASDKSVNIDHAILRQSPTLGSDVESMITVASSKHVDASTTCESFSQKATQKRLNQYIKSLSRTSRADSPSDSVRHTESDKDNGLLQSASTSNRKKKTALPKSQSRSPEGKRKKRALRKSTNEMELRELGKIKHLKKTDKSAEKKKKKKRTKQKGLENSENISEGQQDANVDTLNLIDKESSDTERALSPDTTTKTSLQNSQLSPEPRSSGNEMNEQKSLENDIKLILVNGAKLNAQDTVNQEQQSLDELRAKSPDRERVSSPEKENVADEFCDSSETPQLSPSHIGKISATRIVQLPTQVKVKKNEKDLLEAELGWNSSTFSSAKILVEKEKHHQRRTKLRYYIVKTKQSKNNSDFLAASLKHSSKEPIVADQCSKVKRDNEAVVEKLVSQHDKSKPGQGKSVQFSDNILELEASNADAEGDWLLHRSVSDCTEHEANTKAHCEILNPSSEETLTDTESSHVSKPVAQKKADLRTHITPPRRKRLVWSKKSSKDNRSTAMKVCSGANSCAGAKQQLSTDNVLKSQQRVHLSCPIRTPTGSPKLNMSPQSRRKVSYNKWVNMFATGQTKKSVRKQVAKSGSPVDIKEIIEGTSVDASDHQKVNNKSLDGGVRVAKSVPTLGTTRKPNASTAKKANASDDSLVFLNKKGKKIKAQENWSPRVHPNTHGKNMAGNTVKISYEVAALHDGSSSDVDSNPPAKKKKKYSRSLEFSSSSGKEIRATKKDYHESGTNWHMAPGQESRKPGRANQVHSCGDIMELNVLNMGLTWVMQSVVSRLPFISHKQTDSQTNSSERSHDQESDNASVATVTSSNVTL